MGADPNYKNEGGNTAFLLSVSYDNLDIVKTMYEGGGSLTITDSAGFTPLTCAVFFGKLKIVEYLISLNPNLNHKCNMGKTALDWAKENKHEELIELLEKNLSVPIRIQNDLISINTISDALDFKYKNESDDRTFKDFPILEIIDDLIEAGEYSEAQKKIFIEIEKFPDLFLFYTRLKKVYIGLNDLETPKSILLNSLEKCKIKTYICDDMAKIEEVSGNKLSAVKWWLGQHCAIGLF